MRRTDSLFQLIKALNRTDKRNFKLLTQLTAGTKNYIRLFDAIDRQEVYDEKKIIRQFRSDKMVKQFSVTKNYLYHNILKSLSYFDKSTYGELSTVAIQVHALIDKNLLPHARKLLRKAKTQAARQENFSVWLELLEMERKVLEEEQDFRNYKEKIDAIHEAEVTVRKKAENLQAYRHLRDQVNFIVIEREQARDREESKEMEALLAHPLLRSQEVALSDRAEILYCTILRNYYAYQNQFPDAVRMDLDCLAVFAENTALRDVWTDLFLEVQGNYAHDLLQMHQVDTAEIAIEQLKALKTRSEKAALVSQELYFILKLKQALHTGDVKNGRKILSTLAANLESYIGQSRKSAEIDLYYHAAWLGLVTGQHSASRRWINSLLNEPRTEVRQDLQCYARIANLILHFERGDYDLAEHNLKSTLRFIASRNRMFKAERLMLRTIKQLMRLDEGEEAQKIFLRLQHEIEKLASDQFEFSAVKALFLQAWIESKISGTSMAKILQAHSKEKQMDGKMRIIQSERVSLGGIRT